MGPCRFLLYMTLDVWGSWEKQKCLKHNDAPNFFQDFSQHTMCSSKCSRSFCEWNLCKVKINSPNAKLIVGGIPGTVFWLYSDLLLFLKTPTPFSVLWSRVDVLLGSIQAGNSYNTHSPCLKSNAMCSDAWKCENAAHLTSVVTSTDTPTLMYV